MGATKNFDKQEGVIRRIKDFAEANGLSIRALEATIGASNGVISNAIKRGSDISSKWIVALSQEYRDLSIDWLLHGTGAMKKIDTERSQAPPGIPLLPVELWAGGLNGEQQVMDYECEYYNVPGLEEADFMARIAGDSMLPKYLPGDVVGCKRIEINKISWGKVHAADTSAGGIIKVITPGSDPDHLQFVSLNSTYPPFEMHKSEIYSLARVIGIVSIE